MKTLTVMISGKQGSGKDSLAENLEGLICSSRNMSSEKFRFAAPFYEIHDYAREKMRDLGFEVAEKDGEFLQYLGSEWGKKRFGNDVWVIAMKGEINGQIGFWKNSYDFIPIIVDTRFKIELEAFPEAYKVRLSCPEAIRKERILATPGQNWRENTSHISETELDSYAGKWDRVISTDLVDAKTAASLVFDDIKKRLEIEKWVL